VQKQLGILLRYSGLAWVFFSEIRSSGGVDRHYLPASSLVLQAGCIFPDEIHPGHLYRSRHLRMDCLDLSTVTARVLVIGK
jgi:hypothetical protein